MVAPSAGPGSGPSRRGRPGCTRMDGSASTVGSDPGHPPDLPPRGGKRGCQQCGSTPSTARGCAGGVQGWSAVHRGGNPNCTADLGGRPGRRGATGATPGTRVAGFEAAGGNHLLPAAQLDGEVLCRPVQDGIRTVVERRQGWHVAIPADEHVGGVQQVSWQLRWMCSTSSCIVPSEKVFRSAQRCFNLHHEIIHRSLWI